jgi:hypothetical protein
MSTTTVNDVVLIPNTTDINDSNQDRKAVCGWFMTDNIQLPPKRIYGEGDTSIGFQIVMAMGNYVMLEVFDTFDIQIYGNQMYLNRPYHFCAIFEGSSYGNVVRFYIDGVEQLLSNPDDKEPDKTYLSARDNACFGLPPNDVSVGDVTIYLNSVVKGYYNQWATWNGSSAILSEDTIRKELFEKGALAKYTIQSDTESNMQSDLNTYSNTELPNYPVCLRIEPNATDTNFTLTASGITFNELSSVHVQYTGTATLTWKNDRNSNATIFSTPSGGTINVLNETLLTITNVIEGSEIKIIDHNTYDIIDGTEYLSGNTFSVFIYENIVDIVILLTGYRIKRIENVNTQENTTLSITQFKDNVYYNP